MKIGHTLKAVVWAFVALACCLIGTEAFAAATAAAANTGSSGIGSVAGQALKSLPNIAKLITAGSYVAGMGFAVLAIAKFKAHKDAPTQTHLSLPIVLLFVAAALIFLPSVFKTAGGTLFTSGGTQAGISGLTSF